MVCKYDWQVEWYSVLSKACLDCPMNATSCLRKDCISGNGHIRAIMVVNRMLPGPAVEVCVGDTVQVTVYNQLHLSEATSIHWHGVMQRDTPYMDGVSMITQCPIVSHTYFQYKFRASNVGTHFWHAHSGMQRADGVFGPFIVHEYDEANAYLNAYDYDLASHVITVNDWINETTIAKFAGHHHNDGDNKPSSVLINGRGVLQTYTDSSGRVYETPRASFNVSFGYRYRFRLINAGILYCPIEFSIDGHNLTVIASDGNLLEPREIQSLIIYAGK
jgi:L-ascorbate oxidase